MNNILKLEINKILNFKILIYFIYLKITLMSSIIKKSNYFNSKIK